MVELIYASIQVSKLFTLENINGALKIVKCKDPSSWIAYEDIIIFPTEQFAFCG
jgi:hypothetical protein